MTTVLATKAYKAARAVKPHVPKELKTLPVLHCIHIYHHEGRLAMTAVDADFKPVTEYIPARCKEGELWETCVPAKPFTDWLRVTQNPKAKHCEDQITLWYNPAVVKHERNRLYVKQGNTVAMFYCMSASEFPLLLPVDGQE